MFRDSILGVRGPLLVETVSQDLRYAARVIWKSRAYAVTAILTLALGIGATTAIFAILDSLLLRPLPVREADRLVGIQEHEPSPPFLDHHVWEQIRDRPQLFERVCAWVPTRFNLAERGQADYVQGLRASGAFFETLGVPAALGRTLAPADDQRGGGPDGPVAVISYGYWQRRFGGAVDAIGRSVMLDRVPYTIVGVAPPDFFGPMVGRSFDVVVPSRVTEPSPWMYVLARLRSHETPQSATAALRAAQPQMREAALPAAIATGYAANSFLRNPLVATSAATGQGTPLRGRFRQPLLAMLMLAGLVVIIASAHVANLVLARAVARQHELSVRRALGASRVRLARQVLVESLLLSAAGAALGLAFARGFSRMLVRQVSTETSPMFLDLSLDWRVLGFTAAVAAGTALLFGLAPALRAAGVQPSDALKAGGRGQAGERRWRLNQVLVVAQVGLSVVLVVAAGLFVRTFATMATMDLGFDREGTLIVSLNTEDARVPPSRRPLLYERVREAAATAPGAAAAVALLTTPVSADHWVASVRVVGQAPPPLLRGQGPFLNAVSSGYFAAFGAPILAGRGFGAAEGPNGTLVAVVNESFARLFLGGHNPVGETLMFGPPSAQSPPFQIVGLAKDSGSATYFGLREGIPPTVYLCIGQMSPSVANFEPPAAFRIGVRATRGSAVALTRDVVSAVSRVEPDLRITVRTAGSYVDSTMTTERLTAILSGFFGSLALVLAGVGIFGVTAYVVSRRRAEIGVRIALGASPAGVVRMVLQRVVVLVAAGLVVGAAVSFWTSRFVAAMLFGLQASDPATFAGAAIVLAAVAVVAGWLPARRAAHVDPAVVLRNE